MSAAQKAAIEKELAQYVGLKCGHLVTKEVIVLYGCFGKVYPFCEVCRDWREIAEKLSVNILPAEPLF